MNHKCDKLKSLLSSGNFFSAPGCGDPLTALLIEQEGFEVAFMSGFCVSANQIGMPDTQLISYGEMVNSVRNICSVTSIPIICDGDTGYGNAMNVKRTVHGYAQAGAAAIMIEDQISPKRCGHVAGKSVVDRSTAIQRIVAANDARIESKSNILIMARTDARETHGISEAINRANSFRDAGADILFVEAPRSEIEMEKICIEAPGWHMANMIEGGVTPVLKDYQLKSLGYSFAIYPLTLMSLAINSMLKGLQEFKSNQPRMNLLSFPELKKRVGFNKYHEDEYRYQEKK